MPDRQRVLKDVSIGKIAKTIFKYSPSYTVGEYKIDTPMIHMIQNKPKYTHPPRTQPHKSKIDPNIKCGMCGQLGHNAESEDGHMFFCQMDIV